MAKRRAKEQSIMESWDKFCRTAENTLFYLNMQCYRFLFCVAEAAALGEAKQLKSTTDEQTHNLLEALTGIDAELHKPSSVVHADGLVEVIKFVRKQDLSKASAREDLHALLLKLNVWGTPQPAG
ncbi:MAG: hypothetical protein WC030_00930 [Candidatus Paceibacterota bacterium]